MFLAPWLKQRAGAQSRSPSEAGISPKLCFQKFPKFPKVSQNFPNFPKYIGNLRTFPKIKKICEKSVLILILNLNLNLNPNLILILILSVQYHT
jgi:hypothetical protein